MGHTKTMGISAAMKITVMLLYGASSMLSLILMLSSLSGNWHLNWPIRADHIAHTFIAMTIFSITQLILQYRAVKFSPALLAHYGIVGGSLLVSALYHTFPEVSIFFGGLHLFSFGAFITWYLCRYK